MFDQLFLAINEFFKDILVNLVESFNGFVVWL